MSNRQICLICHGTNQSITYILCQNCTSVYHSNCIRDFYNNANPSNLNRTRCNQCNIEWSNEILNTILNNNQENITELPELNNRQRNNNEEPVLKNGFFEVFMSGVMVGVGLTFYCGALLYNLTTNNGRRR